MTNKYNCATCNDPTDATNSAYIYYFCSDTCKHEHPTNN